MTAAEFFEAQSTTDLENRVIDKFASKYNMFDLIRFAQTYHDNEMRLITNQQQNDNSNMAFRPIRIREDNNS